MMTPPSISKVVSIIRWMLVVPISILGWAIPLYLEVVEFVYDNENAYEYKKSNILIDVAASWPAVLGILALIVIIFSVPRRHRSRWSWVLISIIPGVASIWAIMYNTDPSTRSPHTVFAVLGLYVCSALASALMLLVAGAIAPKHSNAVKALYLALQLLISLYTFVSAHGWFFASFECMTILGGLFAMTIAERTIFR